MQRTWIRGLMLLVVALGSMVVVEDASAQGPVRRALRRLFGRGDFGYSDNFATTTYYRGDANMSGRAWGGAAGATYDAEGRLIGPAVDRSARGGVDAGADIRLDGRAPGARIDADADIRTRGGADVRGGADLRGGAGADVRGGTEADIRARSNVPGTDAGARVRGDADVDVNRNNGAIRGNVEGRARGDVTPPAAPKLPAVPDSSTLPAPAPLP